MRLINIVETRCFRTGLTLTWSHFSFIFLILHRSFLLFHHKLHLSFRDRDGSGEGHWAPLPVASGRVAWMLAAITVHQTFEQTTLSWATSVWHVTWQLMVLRYKEVCSRFVGESKLLRGSMFWLLCRLWFVKPWSGTEEGCEGLWLEAVKVKMMTGN